MYHDFIDMFQGDVDDAQRPYQKYPLPVGNFVRMLQLHPGQYNDTIKATLEVCNLDEVDDQYDALSYLWGRSVSDASIYFDDGMVLHHLQSNLEAALRALRSTSQTRRIWIDAICIDQANDLERGHQIQLMSEIYSRAHTVIAYMNVTTPTLEPTLTEAAADILTFLARDRPFDDSAPWNRLPRAEVIAALGEFLRSEYFQRIWVVQEAALARRIQMVFGQSVISWSGGHGTRRFLTRIKLAEISPSWKTADEGLKDGLMSLDFKPMIELLELSLANLAKREGRVEPQSLLDIVHSMRHRKSVDPRDSIFGMLGMLTPTEGANFARAGLLPDYSRSWEEIYGAIFQLIEARVLSLADEMGEMPLEIPLT